jgi:hypothetical protein
MIISSRLAIRLIIPALGVSCFVGCSKQVGEVTGKVTYLDRPLNYGFLVFVGEDNQPVSATINPDGTYTAKNVPYGLAKVAVKSPDPSRLLEAGKIQSQGAENAPEKYKKREIPAPSLPPGVELAKWFAIPETCGDHMKSGITVTISAPTTPFDIVLQDN